MSDSPRYEITDLLDGRIELRRNGMVMSHHRTWQEAEQAARQIDAEVAHSGWSMPSMTEPMALDAKALEAAKAKLLELHKRVLAARAKHILVLQGASLVEFQDALLDGAIAIECAALPPPAAGEGLEPVAPPPDQLIYAMSQWTDKHPPDPELGYSDADMVELYNLVVSGLAATPAARAAVLEEAASVVEAFILPESGPDYGMMSDATRYVTRKTNRLYQQLAHEIRALKEKT